jgi:hypothetical protein
VAYSSKNRCKQIGQEDLLACLKRLLAERDPDVSPQEFLTQAVQVSELLVEKEQGVYEFAHLSFQEFLAASEVVRLKQEVMLYDKLGLDAWKPTILFYASLVNPTQLIREAIQRNAGDLAYQILRDTPKRVDLSATELQDLTELRCQKLEEYLKAQQWKEADQETYRLMITTVGKEAGQWFDREDLLNFPCEELRAIDQLWVQYSNGHFGFSVQKKIYVECGATLDGKYPGDEIWGKFGDRVGWRKNGEWLYYDDLNPSLSSPQGIFPFFPRRVGGGVFLLRGDVLLSRRDL